MSTLRATSLRGRSNGQSPSLPDGAVVTGVTTSTSFSGNLTGNINSTSATGVSTVGVLTAYSSIHINVGSGSTEVATELSNKTSPGKAIALSMVFG